MSKKIHTLKNILALVAASASMNATFAAATREYIYRPNEIYPIHTGVGIATQIEIDPKEQVKDFGTGYSTGWDLARRENVFYLKPKDLNSDTNMYIRTDRRSYLFDLQIVSKSWKTLDKAKEDGVNYKVTFIYPVELKPTQNSEDKPTSTEKSDDSAIAKKKITGRQTYQFNYDYSADSKSKWLVPKRVYDDGSFTYIDMPQLTSFPAIHAKKNENDHGFVLNSSIDKNTIIVHGTYPYLILRNGNAAVGIRRNEP